MRLHQKVRGESHVAVVVVERFIVCRLARPVYLSDVSLPWSRSHIGKSIWFFSSLPQVVYGTRLFPVVSVLLSWIVVTDCEIVVQQGFVN